MVDRVQRADVCVMKTGTDRFSHLILFDSEALLENSKENFFFKSTVLYIVFLS